MSTMNQSFNLTLGGQCSDTKIQYKEEILNGTDPVIESGMIPVTISDTGAVTTADTTQEWYSYENQQWANVVLVNNTVRSTYINTDGTINGNLPIDEDDILAYYVWIPRYKYRIPELKCSDIDNPTPTVYPDCYSYTLSESDKESLIENFYWHLYDSLELEYTLDEVADMIESILNDGTLLVNKYYYYTFLDLLEEFDPSMETYYEETLNSNKITSGPNTIDIVFESKNATKSIGDAISTYYTHPAFTFGTSELNGMRVGKFEITGNETNPTIKPNNVSLTSQRVSGKFTTSLKFAGGTLLNGIVSFVGVWFNIVNK